MTNKNKRKRSFNNIFKYSYKKTFFEREYDTFLNTDLFTDIEKRHLSKMFPLKNVSLIDPDTGIFLVSNGATRNKDIETMDIIDYNFRRLSSLISDLGDFNLSPEQVEEILEKIESLIVDKLDKKSSFYNALDNYTTIILRGNEDNVEQVVVYKLSGENYDINLPTLDDSRTKISLSAGDSFQKLQYSVFDGTIWQDVSSDIYDDTSIITGYQLDFVKNNIDDVKLNKNLPGVYNSLLDYTNITQRGDQSDLPTITSYKLSGENYDINLPNLNDIRTEIIMDSTTNTPILKYSVFDGTVWQESYFNTYNNDSIITGYQLNNTIDKKLDKIISFYNATENYTSIIMRESFENIEQVIVYKLSGENYDINLPNLNDIRTKISLSAGDSFQKLQYSVFDGTVWQDVSSDIYDDASIITGYQLNFVKDILIADIQANTDKLDLIYEQLSID